MEGQVNVSAQSLTFELGVYSNKSEGVGFDHLMCNFHVIPLSKITPRYLNYLQMECSVHSV
jgi:hypothetical protein